VATALFRIADFGLRIGEQPAAVDDAIAFSVPVRAHEKTIMRPAARCLSLSVSLRLCVEPPFVGRAIGSEGAAAWTA